MALKTEVNASAFRADPDSAIRIFAGSSAAPEAISLGKEIEQFLKGGIVGENRKKFLESLSILVK